MATADRFGARLYRSEQLPDPSFLKTLLGSPKMAPIFLAIRLYLGWQWLHYGLLKVTNPAWTRSGVQLRASWAAATRLPAGAAGAAIHYGWYRSFLLFMLSNHWYIWFGKLVAFGEVAIGLALIVGAFVGVAAFFGALANFNYMLAGASSVTGAVNPGTTVNPVLFGIALILVAGWKVAGYLGADYYLLPLIGTPWKPGHVLDLAREPGVEPKQVKWSVAGTLSWVGVFVLAAVVTVLANRVWDQDQPVIGYLVAAAAVVVAWVIGEALLTATHRVGRTRAITPAQALRRPLT
jgi:thiosulfate dehydrogenase (quinone) large subunit